VHVILSRTLNVCIHKWISYKSETNIVFTLIEILYMVITGFGWICYGKENSENSKIKAIMKVYHHYFSRLTADRIVSITDEL